MNKLIAAALSCALLGASYAPQLMAAEKPVPSVHRYTTLKAWNTNSYWVETDKGIILIDAQLLKSDAALLADIIKGRGKPVLGVLITHPHPDHIGGLATLKDHLGELDIYATEKTAEYFEQSFAQFNQGTAQSFGDDAFTRLVKPTHVVKAGSVLKLGGTEFLMDDVGPSEAHNNTVVWHPDSNTLFTGDATMHHNHFYTGEGHSQSALEAFHYLKKNYTDKNPMLMTGHGDPSRIQILDQHIEYVTFMREVTIEALKDPANMMKDQPMMTREARRKVAEKVVARYPMMGDYGYPAAAIVSWSIFGIEREIQAESSAKMSAL